MGDAATSMTFDYILIIIAINIMLYNIIIAINCC